MITNLNPECLRGLPLNLADPALSAYLESEVPYIPHYASYVSSARKSQYLLLSLRSCRVRPSADSGEVFVKYLDELLPPPRHHQRR